MSAPKRPGSAVDKAKLAVNLAGVSVLAGVLVAGLALPAVGALGITAKNTASSFDDIPDDFVEPPLAQASYIYAADGSPIAKVYERDRTIVKFDDIAPVMRQALVDIEDSRFYEHGAIDLKGVLRAASRNAESGTTSEGASTLTQQYVKNVFVEQAGDDKEAFLKATRQTLGRKIQELKYAIKVEERLTKEQILTNYLNITFFGHQAYGIEAAAQRYFSTSAKKLTLAQAATLAGLVQSPYAYDPIAHPKAAKERRDTVIQRMADLKHVGEPEAAAAKAEPIKLKVSEPRNGCITAGKGMGFYCDYVRKVVKSSTFFGKTAKEREKLWAEGGLRIHTTLDPKMQRAAYRAVTKRVYPSDDVSAAITMIEPGTGKIKAMAQTRQYGLDARKNQTQINFNVDASMGGGNGYQPGSTFKPLATAAAIEAGMPATQVYPSPYKMPYPSMSTCGGTWQNLADEEIPNESRSEVGPYDLKTAMRMSVNTYFVQMAEKTGLCPVKEMVNKLGIRTKANGAKLDQAPSMVLGTLEMSPLSMANAYATFAARGLYCKPRAITSITKADGTKIKVPGAQCQQVMQERTADTINTLLLGVTENGTGTKAQLPGRDVAGKTGTTDNRYAAWFNGYTPELAAAVWLGDPAHSRKMIDITIGGRYYGKVYGGDGAGPIWNLAMSGALDGIDGSSFNRVSIPDYVKPKPPKKDDEDDDRSHDGRPPGIIGGLLGGGQNGGQNGGLLGGNGQNGGATAGQNNGGQGNGGNGQGGNGGTGGTGADNGGQNGTVTGGITFPTPTVIGGNNPFGDGAQP